MTAHYIGTKEILAWPQERDGKPGYAVRYADGYTSWSPAEAFEAAYRRTEGEGQHLTFGDALHMLKQGRKVARAGWNGKGMWIALSPGARQLPADKFWSGHARDHALKQLNGCAVVLPTLIMKTATGEILMGWLASQTDMLADDWTVLP